MLPGWMAGDVNLDMTRVLCQRLLRNLLALQLVERGKQRDEVGARRAEPGATRHVGHGRDLQAAGEAEHLERWPDEIVLDLVWRRHLLGARVFQADVFIGRGAIDVDIDVLVDRGAQDEPAMLRIVRRQVGPAAAERNPIRCSRQNHAFIRCAM